MSQRALLLEAHDTTHIEGRQLSINQAERAWNGQTIPEANQDDVRELLNYRDAFNLVSEYLDQGEPITKVLIREIHRRLVEGVRGGAADPGHYRSIQNYIANSQNGEIIYTPPAPLEVPSLMRELVIWLREESSIHPVIIARIAQFQLVHIHPFVDGNGRTSRLLSTLCLYRAGYDFKRLFTISEYYDRDRSSFYAAIQNVRANDMDLTGWIEYFVYGLATQLLEVRARGETAIRAHVIGVQHGLTSRQTRALDLVLSQGQLSLTDLERAVPGVSRRSLQRDIHVLIQKGLVRESGNGPTDPGRAYRVAEL